jgi:hypothetical protein
MQCFCIIFIFIIYYLQERGSVTVGLFVAELSKVMLENHLHFGKKWLNYAKIIFFRKRKRAFRNGKK